MAFAQLPRARTHIVRVDRTTFFRNREESVTHLVKCPYCGEERQVSNDRFGKKVRCTACENIFISSLSEAVVRPAPPAEKPDQRLMPKVAKMIVPDPSAAAEECISGAISGILAGVVGAIVAGIVQGQGFGDIFGAVLLGFVIGFGVGAVLGALLGAAGRHVRADFSMQRGYAPLVCGALIGTIVTALLENIYWAPLGAALGAVGAHLWPVFCRRVDAVTAPPSRPTAEKDLVGEDTEEKAHHPSMGAS
jgi:hypothetical protein